MNALTVAVVGQFQVGKSTLVNCLLDGKVAAPSSRGEEGQVTTKTAVLYRYGDHECVRVRGKDAPDGREIRLREFLSQSAERGTRGWDSAEVSLWKPLLRQVSILDTPGWNSPDAQDDKSAEDAAFKADYLLFVMKDKGLESADKTMLKDWTERKKPFRVVVNCRGEGGNPAVRQKALLPDIRHDLKNIGATPEEIHVCNLAWFWHASGHAEDGDVVLPKKESRLPPSELAKKSCFLELRGKFDGMDWRKIAILDPVGNLGWLAEVGKARSAAAAVKNRLLQSFEKAIPQGDAQ